MHRLVVLLVPAVALAATYAAPPRRAAPRPAGPPPLFETHEVCFACHNQLSTGEGEDVSISTDWRASVMANSSRDPYWQASVRREVMDHPKAQAHIEDECSICHMPMMRYQARAQGELGKVFENLPPGQSDDYMARLAADGVSCTMCHQIEPDRLGTRASFVGGFVVDTVREPGERIVFGPWAIDSGRTRIMHSSSTFIPEQGLHIRESALCATCHELYTEALDREGRHIGRLPEQVPYQEWLHSRYVRERSCQNCHMPAVTDSIEVSGVWGRPRPALARHVFRGGNFLLLRMLDRYHVELRADALPRELDEAALGTIAFLETQAARVAVEQPRVEYGRLEADVVVTNLTGHKLPTAYPSRRAWLHVTVRDARGQVLFESGALRRDGSIVGNDNDADPTRFEPHYRQITSPDQVQIFESILRDPQGRVTTGLLSSVGYIKDNRVLPAGFDKATAQPDIAVVGDAFGDPSFVGGSDRVHYSVPIGAAAGPLRVEARLWYQPIGFRWAHNLEPYDAVEPRRFVAYYEELSETTAVVLAAAEATTAGGAR
ncbi:MAG TPA: hypothetical protein VFQ38_24410 [Longimicrobiales bacterium]|nr:hypothetical protein [Longimicrobiales bacterium]